MIPSFAIFCLVENHTVIYFNFTDRKVALKIRLVIPGIPETELYGEKQADLSPFISGIFDLIMPKFKIFLLWDQVGSPAVDPILYTLDCCIAQSNSAFILVQIAPDWLSKESISVASSEENLTIAVAGEKSNGGGSSASQTAHKLSKTKISAVAPDDLKLQSNDLTPLSL